MSGNRFFIRRGQALLTLAARHDPHEFYLSRQTKLQVEWGYFSNDVLPKAKPVEAGTTFNVDVHELVEFLDDQGIEQELGSVLKGHLFDETAVCAVIAEMFGRQSRGEEGDLGTELPNLLYTAPCIVRLNWLPQSRWRLITWGRSRIAWLPGTRVLTLAN